MVILVLETCQKIHRRCTRSSSTCLNGGPLRLCRVQAHGFEVNFEALIGKRTRPRSNSNPLTSELLATLLHCMSEQGMPTQNPELGEPSVLSTPLDSSSTTLLDEPIKRIAACPTLKFLLRSPCSALQVHRSRVEDQQARAIDRSRRIVVVGQLAGCRPQGPGLEDPKAEPINHRPEVQP